MNDPRHCVGPPVRLHCMAILPLVCIVDDAPDYRLLVEHLFKRHFTDCSLSSFASGSLFLDELPRLNQVPSLILLDQHMPGLSGYQTLLRLKQQSTYKTIPVVMMSADASESEIKAFYDASANSFLPKPLHFDLLQEQLKQVCHYWLEANQQQPQLA